MQETPPQLVARVGAQAIGTAYVVATCGSITDEIREQAEKKMLEGQKGVQGNRSGKSPMTWEDLRLVMIADLKNAIGILETVRPDADDQNRS